MGGGDDALCQRVFGLLEGMEGISSRRLFGGIGLYRGERLFGLVHRGAIYLRADDAMRRELARRGTGPFRPYRGRVVTAYWELPSDVVVDKRRVRAWARRAMAASDEAARRTPGRPGGRTRLVFTPGRPRRGPRRPLGPRR